jgi:hypothetical protein
LLLRIILILWSSEFHLGRKVEREKVQVLARVRFYDEVYGSFLAVTKIDDSVFLALVEGVGMTGWTDRGIVLTITTFQHLYHGD